MSTNPCEVELSDGAIRNGYLSFNLSSAPFPDTMRGGSTDAEAGDTAHFQTDTGNEFDSDLYLAKPGSDTGRLRHRLAAYFSEIGAKPGDSIFVTPQTNGDYIISRNRPDLAVTPLPSARDQEETLAMPKPPLNQILFGPPGTGKTYQTINKALEILDPKLLSARPNDRRALKVRFDELVQAGRIRFVTFHQSFSYEDFVEGLRADNDDEGNLRYRVESGVFKDICTAARGSAKVAASAGVDELPRIWKISIDGTHASSTRDYCFEKGEARIGWGGIGDLRRPDLLQSPEYQAWGPNDRNTLQAFANELQVGDILLCIKSASEVQAIGVVQGDYRFGPVVPNGVKPNYNNVRPVKWLRTGLGVDLRKLNGGHVFTAKTLYELNRFDWSELTEALVASGVHLDAFAEMTMQTPQDHVLIIDEINRGNVARIFGELITLIEPSKRAGELEQLEVVLPYSRKPFTVPASVHIIGTMNTADRSLATLDIALRRRFEFVEMRARPEFLAGISVAGVDVEAMLRAMNLRIEALLDRDHHLGHAYFLPLRNDSSIGKLSSIFQTQILPLLQEYFFEDWERIRWVLNDQNKKEGHCFVVPPQNNAAGLFGGTSEVPVEARIWEVDPDALTRPQSYLGIIGV